MHCGLSCQLKLLSCIVLWAVTQGIVKWPFYDWTAKLTIPLWALSDDVKHLWHVKTILHITKPSHSYKTKVYKIFNTYDEELLVILRVYLL